MAFQTIQNPGLGQTLTLRSGVRVWLRLAHVSDLGAIASLLERHGEPDAEASAERLVQFNPRRRYVVCAMALMEGAERLTGLGAIDLGAASPRPDVLICDREVGEDLSELLERLLVAAAEAAVRPAAA